MTTITLTNQQCVCVQNKQGNPIMPTTSRKARILLRRKKATIVGYEPFTIRLIYGSSGYKQAISLGIDSGYGTIGFSAITGTTEIISGQVTLLKGHSEGLKERKMYRTNRRSKKRYREPRFNNRRRKVGWLAPSLQHKFDSHIQLVEQLKAILPISELTIEIANFDIQKIRNPLITGEAYQQGVQQDFWNLREYVLHRDNHQCQHGDCSNRAKVKILQVHHLGYWKQDRTNRPANLITLCTKCHTARNHKKDRFLHGWQPTVKPFKPETFMSTIRWRLINTLQGNYTYGYITKGKRIQLELAKTHYHDAFIIAGGTTQHRSEPMFFEQNRRNNRSLQKFYDAKYIDRRTGEKVGAQLLNSGRRSRNKSKQVNTENLRQYWGKKLSKGHVSIRRKRYQYQPKDVVQYQEKTYTVKGIQNYGDYIRLSELSKPVKTSLVSPLKFRKGMCLKI